MRETVRNMSDGTFSDVPFTMFDNKIGKRNLKKAGGVSEVKSKDKKFLILRICLYVILAVMVIYVVLNMLVIPSLADVRIQFKGAKTVTAQQLNAKFQEMESTTWMKFDSEKAATLFGSIPDVESVTIDKHFPDMVVVTIKEREIVAKTIVEIGGRSMNMEIDRNGVIFASNNKSCESDSSVPLVTGIPFVEVQNGVRMPETYRDLMEKIRNIRSLSSNYFASLSEIQVVSKDYGGYELVLFPLHSKVRVLADQNLNEDTLKYMMVALDIVNSIQPDANMIDIRYGGVSFGVR